MKIILTPKLTSMRYGFKVTEPDEITITIGETEETFSLSDVDGQGRTIIPIKLSKCPLTQAVRDDEGTLILHMEKWASAPVLSLPDRPENKAMELTLSARPRMEMQRPKSVLNPDVDEAVLAEWEAYQTAIAEHKKIQTSWDDEKAEYDKKYLELTRLFTSELKEWEKTCETIRSEHQKEQAAFERSMAEEVIEF